MSVVWDNIAINRFFFKLRSRLKVVDDNMVSAEKKTNDEFWKVRPLLNRVQRGCRLNDRSTMVLIDEEMILFVGQVLMRQFVQVFLANRLPKNVNLWSDNELKRIGRGSYDSFASSCIGVEAEQFIHG